MTRFYIPPDQISGGIPQSEPTEIAALKMQVQRMREMLKRLEWLEFPTRRRSMWECATCDAFSPDKEHEPDCELAALLKETE